VLAEPLDELCRRHLDAAFLQPGDERGVVEQVAIAGDDHLSASRDGSLDYGRISRIANLDLDVNSRKRPCQQRQDLGDVDLVDVVGTDLRAPENPRQLVGEIPRPDRNDSTLNRRLEDGPRRRAANKKTGDPDVGVNDDAQRALSAPRERPPSHRVRPLPP
jgi:hypothetical protein